MSDGGGETYHSSTVGNAANVKNVKIFQRSFKLTFFELLKYLY